MVSFKMADEISEEISRNLVAFSVKSSETSEPVRVFETAILLCHMCKKNF